MGKKRTKPTIEQAKLLYSYFEDLLKDRARCKGVMTYEQAQNARDDLRKIDYFDVQLHESLFQWSERHITSDTYSNAIRSVNRKLERGGRSGYSKLKTTVEISKRNRDWLYEMKEDEGLGSLDEVITKLIELKRKANHEG